MSEKRLSTWQKVTALVPLALLSGAWTTSLAVTGTLTATAAGEPGTLPDGSTVPDQAIEAPASVSQPGSIAPGLPEGAASGIVSTASTNGIPAAALAAYQRAAQVMDAADPSCKLPWELLAAIGRVESDHGRYGGNRLDAEGRSVPGIYGIPLDGSNGTARITDTDAGQYDDDPIYDRAVGPMQFIPSTWAVVGVDGDGDDVRDPQDIDDAALASAVYLCSGDEDLSSTAGQRTAVYRYNHSQEYVDLVLSIMNAYLTGHYAAVPNGVAAPTVFAPMPQDVVVTPATSGQRPAQQPRSTGGEVTSTGGSTSGDGPSGSTGGTPEGTHPGDSTDDSTDGDGGVLDPPDGTPTQAPDPVEDTTDTVKDTVNDTGDTVKDTVTELEEATSYCQNQSDAQLKAIGGLQACIDAYLKGGEPKVQGLIDEALGKLTGGIG